MRPRPRPDPTRSAVSRPDDSREHRTTHRKCVQAAGSARPQCAVPLSHTLQNDLVASHARALRDTNKARGRSPTRYYKGESVHRKWVSLSPFASFGCSARGRPSEARLGARQPQPGRRPRSTRRADQYIPPQTKPSATQHAPCRSIQSAPDKPGRRAGVDRCRRRGGV